MFKKPDSNGQPEPEPEPEPEPACIPFGPLMSMGQPPKTPSLKHHAMLNNMLAKVSSRRKRIEEQFNFTGASQLEQKLVRMWVTKGNAFGLSSFACRRAAGISTLS